MKANVCVQISTNRFYIHVILKGELIWEMTLYGKSKQFRSFNLYFKNELLCTKTIEKLSSARLEMMGNNILILSGVKKNNAVLNQRQEIEKGRYCSAVKTSLVHVGLLHMDMQLNS